MRRLELGKVQKKIKEVVEMGLTEKQKRFVDYYIETGNATEAARRAGYQGKNLNRIASENLSKLDTYIKERLDLKEDDRIAKQDEVLRYLTSVMRREYTENVVVTLMEEKTTYVPDEHGTVRKQTIKHEIPQIVEIPAKLSDSNKAAELLGKRYCLWTDKVDVAGDVSVVIRYDYGDDGI